MLLLDGAAVTFADQEPFLVGVERAISSRYGHLPLSIRACYVRCKAVGMLRGGG